MASSWLNRVDRYLRELKQLAGAIDERLKIMRLETSELRTADVDRCNAGLMEQLAELEARIADRANLLGASDAPSTGRTLTEKLEQCDEAAAAEMAERCREISSLISTVNQRAVSLFVCQFHLAQLSADIVRLIAGRTTPPTYGNPNLSERKSELGGGLFNEAA